MYLTLESTVAFFNGLPFAKERFQKTGLQNKVGRAGQQSACLTHNMTPARLTDIRHSNFPILVLCGDEDNVLIQPTSSEYLASQLHARLELFHGGGHAIRLQFPDIHNKLLRSHIDRATEFDRRRQLDAAVASTLRPPLPSQVASTGGWLAELEEAFRASRAQLPFLRVASLIHVEREAVRVVDISFETHSAAATPAVRNSSFAVTLGAPGSPEPLADPPSSPKFMASDDIPVENVANGEADIEEEEAEPRGRGLLARLLPSFGTTRFGFTDFVSMLPGM
ncbi:hypothetical protein HK405_013690 [Cladochytrium tenue]|nr:hypothetical protein HK405_013690 [Cladochytrium tenue]